MTMPVISNFNEAAISTIFDKIVSHAATLGYFDSVLGHEPKNAPGNGVSAAVWVQSIRPYGSGLAITSGVLLLHVRIYTSFLSQPYDAIDPNVLAATSALIGAYSGDFDFGGDGGVRAVDLLGMSGTPLNAQAGYVEIDRKIMRIMTISLPVMVNDMWVQGSSANG